jgi:RimJ/RimL family protein N-acetyltransferase
MAVTSEIPCPITVRPLQYRDLEAMEQMWADFKPNQISQEDWQANPLSIHRWYWPLQAFNWFPNPWRHFVSFYMAEQERRPLGLIQVTPFNRSRTTWQIQQVLSVGTVGPNGSLALGADVGSQLLRYCLEHILEARTWIADVDINHKQNLALYRKNGFQPLAQITRWTIDPTLLQTLAEREPTLPNLLPVGNADARLLYQLDTVSMPPLLRQVFDRHGQDFQTGLIVGLLSQGKQLLSPQQSINQYVFEPQRKAAIGHFKLVLSQDGSQPHRAKLTVHPAYTWLYPELLTHMAQLTQAYPRQSLSLKSADYQPEREAYLERIQADRRSHSLLMSRSVWHKLREQRGVSLEALQLSDMLQGLQPNRKPVPGRMIHQWHRSHFPSQPKNHGK